MTYKWGTNGSGCQKNYTQNFEKEGSDDSHIFITSLVPLRLVVNKIIRPFGKTCERDLQDSVDRLG